MSDEQTHRVSVDALRTFCTHAFTQCGVAHDDAQITADVLCKPICEESHPMG